MAGKAGAIVTAAQFFTTYDEMQGYPRTREALRAYSEQELIRSYHETLRDSFNSMFGRNAGQFFNLVAEELLRRGITELPNLFGPIRVKTLEPRPSYRMVRR